MLQAALVMWGLVSEASPSEDGARGPSFSLVYAGGSDCPSRANFEAAIIARAPNARVADGASADVRFEVEAAPAADQKRRLRVALSDGTSQDREIDADDCAEAVQSMAVIAAMILASRETAPQLEATSNEPAQPLEPDAPSPTPEPARPAQRAARAPSVGRPSRPTWLAAGAGLGLEGAAAPSPTFAASAFAELGSVTRGWLAPSLRLSALFGQAPDASPSSAGAARFRLLLARVHGCGVHFDATKADLRLCAVVEGGALFARGIDALNGRQQTMGWLGAGLGAIGGLRLGQRWTLELGGGARALLVRDKFVFKPRTGIHQPPVIAWDSRVALSRRFW